MTINEKIENTLKLETLKNKKQIGEINNCLDEIVSNYNGFQKNSIELTDKIIKTGVITHAIIKKVQGGDNSFKPSHINTLSKIFNRDVLSNNDWVKFNPVKKQALKKSMKMAVAVILEGIAGKDKNGKSVNSKGEFMVNSSKLSLEQNNKFNKSDILDFPINVKNLTSLSDDILNFKGADTTKSSLNVAFSRAFRLLEEYDNKFQNLPNDCRLAWRSWALKINSIQEYYNKVDSKIYVNK